MSAMDVAPMACWLPDEPPCGATPTPSIGLPEEAGSGGDDAAVDECDDGGADGDSGGDFDGDGDGEAEEEEAPMLVAAAFSPLGVAPPTAAEARRAPSSFVAMLQASPSNAAAAAPRAPALAPGVASAGGLPASSPYRSGAAGAGATPTHARDVPVRASAAAALHTARDSEYKDAPEMKRLRSAVAITREDLASCFHMPSEQACRKLGIGLTVLKRQCRKFGIKRWPFRKIKSLDRLINNVSQGLVPSEGGRVPIKSVEELEEQKRQMEVCAIDDLDEETKRLQQAYSKANHKLRRMAEGLPAQARPRPRAPLPNAGAGASGERWRYAAAGVEEEYSDEEEEEEEEEEPVVEEEGDPNKRRRKPNPRYLDPPTKRKKKKVHRHSLGGGGAKGPPSLAALDADLLASLAEAAEAHEHGGGRGGGGGGNEDASGDGEGGPGGKPRVNLDIVRQALAEHATGITSAIEAAYGAEATANSAIRAALDAENLRLQNRIVGLLSFASVL